MSHLKISILIIMVANILTFSQINHIAKTEIQSYSYKDKLIRIEISAPYRIAKNDSIKFNITITNLTNKDIYILKDLYLSYIISKKIVCIEHGGSFEVNYDREIELLKIRPQNNRSLNIVASSDDLIKRGYSSNFDVQYELGFIPNLMDFKKYSNLSGFKPKPTKDRLIISNEIAQAILKMSGYRIFGIKIIDK